MSFKSVSKYSINNKQALLWTGATILPEHMMTWTERYKGHSAPVG